MKTVTQWFTSRIKPVNIGVYESESGVGTVYRFWGGKFWGVVCYTPKEAADWGVHLKSARQTARWRGLAVKPKSGIKSR